jgi:hypothetical protein
MFSQTLQDQLSTFEETLLLSLFSIINQISRELLNQTDLLNPKTQALHRLYLSYLREFQRVKKHVLPPAPDISRSKPRTARASESKVSATKLPDSKPSEPQSSPELKASESKASESKALSVNQSPPKRISAAEMQRKIREVPPGLLMHPFPPLNHDLPGLLNPSGKPSFMRGKHYAGTQNLFQSGMKAKPASSGARP